MTNNEKTLAAFYSCVRFETFTTAPWIQNVEAMGVNPNSISGSISSLGKQGYLIKKSWHWTENNRKEYIWQINPQKFYQFPWTGDFSWLQ